MTNRWEANTENKEKVFGGVRKCAAYFNALFKPLNAFSFSVG